MCETQGATSPNPTSDSIDFTDLLRIAETGIHPDKRDPIDGETADDAYERYLETGIKNPFHAETIDERLQNGYGSEVE